ncbi:Mitochondrial distribution and morphology protein 12, partial [Quaeritorhiza haematococci]
MSFEIHWEKLDSTVSNSLKDFLNHHLETSIADQKPNFIGHIQVIDLDFGSTPPDIEIADICDPLPEFYLGDDDVDDVDEDMIIDPHYHLQHHHGHQGGPQNNIWGGIMDDGASVLSAGTATTRGSRGSVVMRGLGDEGIYTTLPDTGADQRLPPSAAQDPYLIATQSPQQPQHILRQRYQSPSSVPPPTNASTSTLATAMSGVAGSSPRISVSGSGSMSNIRASPSMYGRSMQPEYQYNAGMGGRGPIQSMLTSSPTSDLSGMSNDGNINPNMDPNGRVNAPGGSAAAGAGAGAGGHPDHVQLELRIHYTGNMKLTIATELIVNQPTPAFMVLPLTVTLSGFGFRGLAIIAYLGDRINFCFKEPEVGK